jgi:energy-coupling factor transport system substrate-specific component
LEKKHVTMGEIILTVILALVFGVVYKVVGPVYEFASSITPFFGEFIYPIWFIAAIIAGYIIQKPGVAFFAELLAASGEILTGGQYGLTTLLSGVLQGVGAEAVFFAFGYKRWNIGVLLLASVFATFGSFIVDYAVYGFGTKTTFIQISSLIARFVGSLVVCGLLGKWISDALAATGVLNNYAIVRSKQTARWDSK